MRALLALLLCLAPSLTLAQVVVKADWMLKADKSMTAAGLTDKIVHCRPYELTRYELAVKLHHASRVLIRKSTSERAEEAGNIAFLRRAKPVVEVFKRLALELKRELVSLGVPFDQEFYAELDALETRIEVLTRDRAPDQPPKWVLDSITDLKEVGLLVGYPESRHNWGRQTRYEVAVAIHAAGDYFGKIWDASVAREEVVAESDPTDLSVIKAREELMENWKSMRRWQPEVSKLKKLATAYRQELAALGVDVPRFMTIFPRYEKYYASYTPPQVGSRHGPFTDVPTNHWASDAVETLRKARILVGYPDHKFKG